MIEYKQGKLVDRTLEKYIVKRYRIVTDSYGGYEVQKRYFGFLWSELGTNTHISIDDAKKFIEEDAKKRLFKSNIIWP